MLKLLTVYKKAKDISNYTSILFITLKIKYDILKY